MNCVFCKIIKKGNFINSNNNAVLFNDLHPVAPFHMLVVPKVHYKDITEIPSNVLGDMIKLTGDITKKKLKGEFRLIFNTGLSAGQSVFHAHGHIIGGKSLGWTPS